MASGERSMSKIQTFTAALLACLALLGGSMVKRAASAESQARASLQMMIGQMLVVGFSGNAADNGDVAKLSSQIRHGDIGGVLVLTRNIQGPQQLADLTAHLQKASADVPLFISIDQEGGYIQRLTASGFSQWDSAEYVALRATEEASGFVLEYYSPRAKELHDLGINLNFGPVVDLNANPANPIIGELERSYSRDPNVVATMASDFVRAHRAAGVLSTVKHFPGHGSSVDDSHESLPNISMTWSKAELIPYQMLADAGLIDVAMVGHLVHSQFSDTPQTPTSLSTKALRTLRTIVGDHSVIVTDDMQMRAVTDQYSEEEAAILAILAGNDLLIYSTFKTSDSDVGPRVNQAIQNAVSNGRISRERIAQSFARIVQMKARIGRSVSRFRQPTRAVDRGRFLFRPTNKFSVW
jgi:beta-N-acetylhexosaminidase